MSEASPFFNIKNTQIDIEEISDFLAGALAVWREASEEEGVAPPYGAGGMEIMSLPSNMVAHAYVVDYDRERDDFRYRFWGSGNVNVFGVDYTGKWFSQLPNSYGQPSRDSYLLSLERKNPLLFLQEYTCGGALHKFQYVLRLPLSRDDKDVDTVLTVTEQLYDPQQLERHRAGIGG